MPTFRGGPQWQCGCHGPESLGFEPVFWARRHHRQGKALGWKPWLVGLAVVDGSTGVLLAQTGHQGPGNNCAYLGWMVDAEFDSERNHRQVHQVLGAESIIAAKPGSSHWKIKGIGAQMRTGFPQAKYGP